MILPILPVFLYLSTWSKISHIIVYPWLKGQLRPVTTKALSNMGREAKDMTLKLADDLLLCILSFLPTKDALRTSVLSRRWRYLWTSISNIDLDDSISYTDRPPDYPHCRTSFLHFVYRLLLAHDDSDITKFKVSCDVPVDAVCVYSWICAVIKHNVKELDLHFPLKESCILPSCLFSSQSLIKLSIDFVDCKGVLGLPYPLSGGCPCLKSLNLSQVKFSNDYSTKKLFFELSSIFPTLQQLSLVFCEWKNINHLVITSSTLVSITMEIDDGELLDCEVTVTAPRLAAFYCWTDCSIGISLAYPSIFADASLEFLGDYQDVIVYQRLERLLSRILNSTSLTLSTMTLSAARRFFDHTPVLQKLTNLDICNRIMSSTVEEILELMHKTPNLEYLSISLDCQDDDIDEWWTVNPVPGCVMKKLKKLKVSGLDAAKAEIHLINFFLENACNLEKIEVQAQDWNAEKLEIVKTGLLALHGSSGKCAFAFEVVSRPIK